MPIPESLTVALKEWATVCSALAESRQIILLRKGGIFESGGEFEIEHRQFLLFPTYLHQKLEMLKPAEHSKLKSLHAEPEKIALSLAGEITHILPMKSRAAMDSLDDQHIWTPSLIDMRFNYRPENPLYLLLVRAYRLGEPITIENTPAYAGCKSWVPLDQSISTANAIAVLDHSQYSNHVENILDRIDAGRGDC
jgi:hypothetical protein